MRAYKARFPLAIFFVRIDIFRRYIFSPVDFFYDRARDANFKCQQINMAAVNIRHLLNVKINIIRLLLLRRRRKRLEKYKERFSVQRIYAEREQKGEYHLLVKELMLYDEEYFFHCFHMSPATFEKLLSWIGPLLKRASTKMREAISPSEQWRRQGIEVGGGDNLAPRARAI